MYLEARFFSKCVLLSQPLLQLPILSLIQGCFPLVGLDLTLTGAIIFRGQTHGQLNHWCGNIQIGDDFGTKTLAETLRCFAH